MPSCPTCQSTDVARAAAVYEQGVSTSRSNTAGAGIGSGGVAAGGATTRGVSMTLAAQKNAPPKQSNAPGVAALLIWIVGGIAALSAGQPVALPVFFALGIIAAVFLGSHAQSAYLARRAAWERTWYCLRCGAQFVEPAAAEAAPQI